MCGIAGVYALDAKQEQLEAMLACIRHRGPDDKGVWQGDGLLLGQRRLSIIDLSVGGHQPMLSPDERFVITFNGEIYNFLELRQELQAAGVVFRSDSDTEVLLRGYEKWGERVLDRLVGMFAFAIWDRRERTLFLARDRAGEKPLYYVARGSDFAFASEVGALAKLPWVDRTISHGAVALYLHYQYIPAPWSIYKDVHKLPPGHAMRVHADGRQEIWQYWNPVAMAQEVSMDAGAAREELEALLARSVRGQLISDVPLGAFLSGGVDSSLIVALMCEQSSQVKTFTIGFEVKEFNEAEHAQAVAQFLGTEHTTEFLTERDALALVPRVPGMYGEPFADSSALPTHLVSAVARKHVTVALSGDGGDEAFGGYSRYDFLEKFARPAALLGPVAPLLRPALPHLPYRMRRALELAGKSQSEVYRGMVSTFHGEQVEELTGLNPALPLFDQSWAKAGLSPRRRAMLADLLTYMPEAILVKVDRAAMATSLETRAPILDHRVLEFALKLPTPLVQQKKLLKEILYKRVPQALIDRPKQGFGVPLDRWFRSELRELLFDSLTPDALQKAGILRPARIGQLLEEHQSGRANHASRLWALLVLCLWVEAEHVS